LDCILKEELKRLIEKANQQQEKKKALKLGSSKKKALKSGGSKQYKGCKKKNI